VKEFSQLRKQSTDDRYPLTGRNPLASLRKVCSSLFAAIATKESGFILWALQDEPIAQDVPDLLVASVCSNRRRVFIASSWAPTVVS
jgi:hypothetical protein